MTEARRLLVVEDNAEACAVLCELVSAWGYQADAAEDGWHALDLVGSHAPDVIITDLSLPDGGACEVIRAVKSRLGPDVLIIAYTGWEHLRAAAMAAGADAFVLKPELDCLEEVLRALETGAARRGAPRR